MAVIYLSAVTANNEIYVSLLPFMRGSLSFVSVEGWVEWEKFAMYVAVTWSLFFYSLKFRRRAIAAILVASVAAAPLLYFLETVIKPDAQAVAAHCVDSPRGFTLCAAQVSLHSQSIALQQIDALDEIAPGLLKGAVLYQYVIDSKDLPKVTPETRRIEIGFAGGGWADAAQIDPAEFRSALAQNVLPNCQDGGGVSDSGELRPASANQAFANATFGALGLDETGAIPQQTIVNSVFADYSGWKAEIAYLRAMNTEEKSAWIAVHRKEIFDCTLTRKSFSTRQS